MLTLAPNSQIKVENRSDSLAVRILNGLLSFVPVPSTSVHVYSGGTAVQARSNVATTVAAPGTAEGFASNLVKTPPPPDPTPSPLSRQ